MAQEGFWQQRSILDVPGGPKQSLRDAGIDLSVSGVLVFAGLTAWDTQKIKSMYDASDDSQSAGRKAVMGALSLYLDFINLFLMLLRIFGNSR